MLSEKYHYLHAYICRKLDSEVAEQQGQSLSDKKKTTQDTPRMEHFRQRFAFHQITVSLQRHQAALTSEVPALPDAHKPFPFPLGSGQPGTISYLLSQEPPSPTGWTLVPGERAEKLKEEPISYSITCCDFTVVGGRASSCCLMGRAAAGLHPHCRATGALHWCL